MINKNEERKSFWKSIWKSISKKDPAKKTIPEDFSSDRPTNEGVYNEEGEPISKQLKRFSWVHYFLKYKIIVPSLLLTSHLFRKKLVREIPARNHFNYANMFDEAFEKALESWVNDYQAKRLFVNTGKTKSWAFWRGRYSNPKISSGVNLLRIFKELTNTIVTHDTAYMEFQTILMFEITKAMNKHWEGHREAKHLLYTSKGVEDVAYFALQPTINNIKGDIDEGSK